MSIVASLTIPATEFALGRTLEAIPDVSVEFERCVTHSQEWVMPFLWVNGPRLRAFEREVGADPTVEEYEIIDRYEDVHHYEIRWSDEIVSIVNEIFDRSGTLVSAVGDASGWNVLVQFNTRHGLGALQEEFDTEKSRFSVERIYTPDRPRQTLHYLTPEQRVALTAAVELGYLSVPRETTLKELADSLDVSTTALSERLRRAQYALATSVLETTPGGGGYSGP